ncbi:hypothetical protein Poli38472_006278 [Pythium oligandrum]|uniref:Threonyl/alanyl tRNA synthetase SAD domain-containing protein n=1 Tax=Pythium oligandrum TaxID=41045 RepID=A0A8K1CUB0_PYTOL|nr:hypothetical protein Poli38472_006278 [Pythium oligandrum]|eukprot:TMW68810.1 hypothetical protein Poli38472_006278 [Pythium oligandrum]
MSPTATPTAALPGGLACQRDSSLRELTTLVHACDALDERFYELELLDTVLFPEGGGQPCDTGRINDAVVDKVYVKDGRCVHRVASGADGAAPFMVGEQVHVIVDWARRFDHMQQHSGQHLLSAICEKYGYDTTTWSLGDERCNIELVPFPSNEAAKQSKEKVVPAAILQQIEADVNDAIVRGLAMKPQFLAKDAPEWEHVAGKFDEAQRPEVLRVVVIDGVDSNPCCGTHVLNIAQLQSLRILNTEYARGATRVWFVVGGRVNREFARMFQREQQLTKLLSCAPDEHSSRIDKFLQFQRSATKEIKALQKEAAVAIATELLANSQQGDANKTPVVHYHRKDADLSFLQNILTSLGEAKASTVFVLSAGDARGEGSFVLAGPSALIQEHGKTVIEVIEGKGGGGKNGVLQGKAKKLGNVSALIEQLQALQV